MAKLPVGRVSGAAPLQGKAQAMRDIEDSLDNPLSPHLEKQLWLWIHEYVRSAHVAHSFPDSGKVKAQVARIDRHAKALADAMDRLSGDHTQAGNEALHQIVPDRGQFLDIRTSVGTLISASGDALTRLDEITVSTAGGRPSRGELVAFAAGVRSLLLAHGENLNWKTSVDNERQNLLVDVCYALIKCAPPELRRAKQTLAEFLYKNRQQNP